MTASNDLKHRLVAGVAKVASLLVQCDTYQQLYMAPEPALRPPEDVLGRLKASIVKAYTQSQLFFVFAYQQQQNNKMRAATAIFRLDDADSQLDKLSQVERQLILVADECQSHSHLSSRKELRQLANDIHQVVLDQM